MVHTCVISNHKKSKTLMYNGISVTLRLHYNAGLYNADTVCENISRWSRYSQCKLWKSYSL